jgi:hypothetical protein
MVGIGGAPTTDVNFRARHWLGSGGRRRRSAGLWGPRLRGTPEGEDKEENE